MSLKVDEIDFLTSHDYEIVHGYAKNITHTRKSLYICMYGRCR